MRYLKTAVATKQLSMSWAIGESDKFASTDCDLVVFWRGLRITITKGYGTDGASIPKAAWSIIGHPWQAYLPAAIPHDALYNSELLPRFAADLCFHDLMESLHVVNPIRLHAMFYAVRYLGWWGWLWRTDEQREEARRHLKIEFSLQLLEEDG